MKRLLHILAVISIFGLNFTTDEANAATPALRVNGVQYGANDVTVYATAYGAKGDNSTDNRAAIAAALTACPSTGCTVVFPSGTYLVTPVSNIGIQVSKPFVRFIGAGRGTTTIKTTAVASAGLISLTGGAAQGAGPYTPQCATSTTGFACSFQIEGINLVGSQVLAGLQAYNTAPGSNAPGIQVTGDLSDVVIKDCAFSGFDTAIDVPLQTNLPALHNSFISRNAFTGLFPTDTVNIKWHFPMRLNCDGTLVEGNFANGFAYGVNVFGSSVFDDMENRIIGNHIKLANGFDVAIYSSVNAKTIIANNIVDVPASGDTVGDQCIKVGAANSPITQNSVVIHGNQCNGGHIKISDSTGVTVADNVIRNSVDHGVVIDTATGSVATPFANRITITGNQIYAPTNSCIVATTANGLSPTQLNISNNQCTNYGSFGIIVDLADQVVVSGNQVLLSGGAVSQAILLRGCSRFSVVGNTISSPDFTGTGIEIGVSGSTVSTLGTVSNNLVQGLHLGVRLNGGTTHTLVTSNVLRGRSATPTDSGVFIDSSGAVPQYNLIAFNNFAGYAKTDSGTSNTWISNNYAANNAYVTP